jgi:hypothetical protein
MADVKGDFRRGDPITAEWANAVAEATGIRIRAGAGLQARKGRGTIQLTSIAENTKYLAKATSAFAVSTSTTPSSGTADMYYVDETGPTYRTLGISLPKVYCAVTKAQTSGNAINSGQLCWVEKDPLGIWFIAPLECT